jgi:hypothetical protein
MGMGEGRGFAYDTAADQKTPNNYRPGCLLWYPDSALDTLANGVMWLEDVAELVSHFVAKRQQYDPGDSNVG